MDITGVLEGKKWGERERKTVHNTGPLIGRRKKVKFRGIFRDKFEEKTVDFMEKFRTNFTAKQWLKKANCAEIFWANFARK